VKLLLDATVAPADIRYSTDIKLLKEAREQTEIVIDFAKHCANSWDMSVAILPMVLLSNAFMEWK